MSTSASSSPTRRLSQAKRLPCPSPSVRGHLALLYTLLLGFSLIASDAMIYLALDRYLRRETDEGLAAQAREIAGTTQVIVDRFSFEPRIALPNLNVFASPGVSVQALTPDAQVVRRSANLGSRDLPVDREALERALAGTPEYGSVAIGGTPFRILYAPIELGSEIAFVLQVARSMRDLEMALKWLQLAFAGIGGLSLLIAALAGWWLARAALSPIDRLTRDARAIGDSRDFGRRVADLPPRDEVGRLAATFNEMLAQLQAAYGELEQTLASQRRFVADASHELRTPLTTIRTNLELLRRAGDTLEPADREEAMADALAEIGRLSRLVGDLLTLARVDSGQRIERHEPVRVEGLLQDVYRQARLMALPREQRVVLAEPADATVVGDPDALKELLLILVDNAVSYTPDGGEIRLGAERADGEVVLSVADEGIGIASDDLGHIFERFYRADRTRTRGPFSSRGGTGLGLSIARWIVDEHGGRIAVRSRVGQGSTFTVHLPVAVVPPADDAATTPPPATAEPAATPTPAVATVEA